MKNLIITIALVLCIFGVFMIKLNYEASTIPEVEEWYYSYDLKFDDFLYDMDYRDISLCLNSTNSMTIRIVSGDKKDTIDSKITWEMLENIFKN